MKNSPSILITSVTCLVFALGACGGAEEEIGYTEEAIFNTGSGTLSYTCTHNPDNTYCSCSGSWDCAAMRKQCEAVGGLVGCSGLGAGQTCCCNSSNKICDSSCKEHSPPYGQCEHSIAPGGFLQPIELQPVTTLAK